MTKLSDYMYMLRNLLDHQLLPNELLKLISLDQVLCADESANGQLGVISRLSILLMPMLLYLCFADFSRSTEQ